MIVRHELRTGIRMVQVAMVNADPKVPRATEVNDVSATYCNAVIGLNPAAGCNVQASA
jgi:hypothetical protein